MKIRNRLYLGALISITLVVALVSVTLITSNQVAQASKQQEIAYEMHLAISELDILTYEYLMHYEKRAEQQWKLRYHATAASVGEELAVSIRADYAVFGDLFSEVTANHKKRLRLIQEGASQEKIDATAVLEERLVAQLLVQSQSIIAGSSMLAEKSHAELMEALELDRNLTLALMLVIAIAVVGTSLLVARSISKPLGLLVEGAEAIGRGNLDYKLGTAAKDEIGGLSRAFDRMTEDLKATTVSRDELAVEVAERKRAEEELKETMAELERSNAELERFAYVASHDLQEPLRMVSSFTQLLARRYKDRLDADADEFINYAVGGAKRMQELLNDLLSYSRIGTRGKPFGPTDFTAVLDAAVANLDVAIRGSGAEVTHDPLPAVMADETQLVQLLQNLIDNAIKFHGEEPPRVHVSAERKGDEWVFSVRDNGVGIDPQYFERVFIVFQRLRHEDSPGTGIGLSIAKRVVERHSGRIWLESQPGEGSTVYFTLQAKGGRQRG